MGADLAAGLKSNGEPATAVDRVEDLLMFGGDHGPTGHRSGHGRLGRFVVRSRLVGMSVRGLAGHRRQVPAAASRTT